MAVVKDKPCFDVEALRDIAGEKVFARGEDYHREGQVAVLSLESGRVLAQVAGTEDYRTVVTGGGKKIGGECSCPAFEDWGFCKHMVATALTANDQSASGAGPLGRIRDHLKNKGTEALVEMILELAEHDPALFRRLDIAAAARGDDKTLEARLRKAIDGATRTRGLIEYRQAPAWAKGVHAALDAVDEIASNGRAGLALKLAEHAVDRIEEAAGAMDDSDGYCGGLLERARDIHLAAAGAARPDPVALARDLFARETEDAYGIFDGAVELYAGVLGKKGAAEYRRLAEEAWAKLPARTRAVRKRHEYAPEYDRIERILDVFAQRESDVDARVALRAKDLSSPYEYLELAEFCRAQGRVVEALRYAEEGLWVFEDDRPDGRLVALVADLLLKSGRKADAAAHLWRAFEK